MFLVIFSSQRIEVEEPKIIGPNEKRTEFEGPKNQRAENKRARNKKDRKFKGPKIKRAEKHQNQVNELQTNQSPLEITILRRDLRY